MGLHWSMETPLIFVKSYAAGSSGLMWVAERGGGLPKLGVVDLIKEEINVGSNLKILKTVKGMY